MDYFDKFPTINYRPSADMEEVVLRNITRRVKFTDDIRNSPYTLLPYTVTEGMTAEKVAYYYYGDARYVWLVYLANQIKDPYFEWVLDTDVFNEMVINKYQQDAIKWWNNNGQDGPEPVGNIVLQWTMRTDIDDNILFYRNKEDSEETIGYTTFIKLSDPLTAWIDPEFDSTQWEAIRVYEYEQEKNESYRNIQLVNKDYLDLIEKDLETLLNG